MKKALFYLLLGGIAGSAFAQSSTANLPENSVVLGTHILKNQNLACSNPEAEQPALQNVSPVVISLVNPNATQKVAGVQARITYDASKFEVVDPSAAPGSCFSANGGGFVGAQNTVFPTGSSFVINYETPSGNTGAVNMAIANSTGVATGGALVTLFFRVKAGATGESAFGFDPDPTKFVIAAENPPTGGGTVAKNAIPGKLIVGTANDSSVDVGAAIGSASTDGTVVYAVDNRGVMFVLTPGGGSVLAQQLTANRTGAPTEGRPVIRDGKVTIVSTNGKVQSFNATAPYASQINPAVGPTLPAGASVRSTPAVAGGRIIFTNTAGGVHSVDAATGGTPTASTGVTASATSSPALVPSTAAGTPDRVVVGGTNSILILNAADLTPVSGVNLPTSTNVSASPYVGPTGIGFVGDDNGNIYTFDVTTGLQVGSTVNSGEPIRSSPIGFGIAGANGALFVGVNGRVTIVSALGAAVGAPVALTPPAAPPAGTELFGVQQAPIIRGNTALIGDSIGNLYQVTVNPTTGATAGPVRNFGSAAITALTSPAVNQVAFLVNRANLIQTTYAP